MISLATVQQEQWKLKKQSGHYPENCGGESYLMLQSKISVPKPFISAIHLIYIFYFCYCNDPWTYINVIHLLAFIGVVIRVTLQIQLVADSVEYFLCNIYRVFIFLTLTV